MPAAARSLFPSALPLQLHAAQKSLDMSDVGECPECDLALGEDKALRRLVRHGEVQSACTGGSLRVLIARDNGWLVSFLLGHESLVAEMFREGKSEEESGTPEWRPAQTAATYAVAATACSFSA